MSERGRVSAVAEVVTTAQEFAVTTVACRTCSSGWYGQAGDRCPRCKGDVVVTDTFRALPVALLDQCEGVCVAFGCQGPCGA